MWYSSVVCLCNASAADVVAVAAFERRVWGNSNWPGSGCLGDRDCRFYGALWNGKPHMASKMRGWGRAAWVPTQWQHSLRPVHVLSENLGVLSGDPSPDAARYGRPGVCLLPPLFFDIHPTPSVVHPRLKGWVSGTSRSFSSTLLCAPSSWTRSPLRPYTMASATDPLAGLTGNKFNTFGAPFVGFGFSCLSVHFLVSRSSTVPDLHHIGCWEPSAPRCIPTSAAIHRIDRSTRAW